MIMLKNASCHTYTTDTEDWNWHLIYSSCLLVCQLAVQEMWELTVVICVQKDIIQPGSLQIDCCHRLYSVAHFITYTPCWKSHLLFTVSTDDFLNSERFHSVILTKKYFHFVFFSPKIWIPFSAFHNEIWILFTISCQLEWFIWKLGWVCNMLTTFAML